MLPTPSARGYLRQGFPAVVAGLVRVDSDGRRRTRYATPRRLATSSLRELWDKQKDRPATSSVYHFGLDSSEDRLAGWRYRSVNAFQSENLPDETVGILPAPDSLIRRWAQGQTIDERIHAFVELAAAPAALG